MVYSKRVAKVDWNSISHISLFVFEFIYSTLELLSGKGIVVVGHENKA